MHIDGYFRGPTDVAWDSDDNIYISDGYTQLARRQVRQARQLDQVVGSRGPAAHANENPASSTRRTTSPIDRQNNVYVADRSNRRIQVFDRDGNVPAVHPAERAVRQDAASGARQPDPAPARTRRSRGRSASRTTPTQYLYASDAEPGAIYKLTLDGKIVGMLGESGHELGQFNWIARHRVPDRRTRCYVADMNNWRVQKLILHP